MNPLEPRSGWSVCWHRARGVPGVRWVRGSGRCVRGWRDDRNVCGWNRSRGDVPRQWAGGRRAHQRMTAENGESWAEVGHSASPWRSTFLQVDARHRGVEHVVGPYVLNTGGGTFALIDPGPMSTYERVRRGIQECGLEPAGLRAVLLTHIHLDHAGSAGAFATDAQVPVYVHELGAPHLADPSRLVASARRVFGERFDSLWGGFASVPASLLRPISGRSRLRIGASDLHIVGTPGHARHHIAFLNGDGTLFVGDAAGIRLGGDAPPVPATPAPEVDLVAWRATFARILAERPARLALAHYGVFEDVSEHVDRLAAAHDRYERAVERALREGAVDGALNAIRAELASDCGDLPPRLSARYAAAAPADVLAGGLVRWVKTRG